MDPLLAARRLPRIAELAMRTAIVRSLARGRLTPRALVDESLLRFETVVARQLGSVRPALLFAERDRIARELRAFVDGRLAARLAALRAHQIVSAGRAAAPFDLIVRNPRGRTFGVVFRRFPEGGRRLDLLRRVRAALQTARTPLDGVLVYDFVRASARLVLNQARANRVDRYLRAS